MRSETREYQQNAFKPEIHRLSELLGRDLMHWIETTEGRLPASAKGPGLAERKSGRIETSGAAAVND
jgi:hypothetical protein